MSSGDRRFLRILLLAFGPLFVAGGYLAGFTYVGAILIFVGLGMLTTGFLLLARLPTTLAVLSGLAVTVAMTVWMAIDLSQRS